MTYLIATEIAGFRYYAKFFESSRNSYNTTYSIEWQGFKNNATIFDTEYEANRAIKRARSNKEVFVIPNKQ